LKVAVTLAAALIVTWQVPVPGHEARDQPEKTELELVGAAVRVTTWPSVKSLEHVEPQLIPEGAEVTVPLPLPVFATVKVKRVLKVAVTVFAAEMETVHGPVPVQLGSDQPVNAEPPAAEAVRTTEPPSGKFAVWLGQLAPQLIPVGLEVTVPEPLPALATVSG
jgi:hypothetical protein